MMKRNLFLLSIICLATWTMAAANEGEKKKKSSVPTIIKSKTGKKTSTKIVLKNTVKSPARSSDSVDPKAGFKDLFDNFSASNNTRLNPRAVSFVQDYMDKHSTDLLKMKGWGKPYFNMMDAILLQHGLPIELKYLAVIESMLKPGAISWVGAVGPWQFMPGTAKVMGLKINSRIDERTDYYKSTHAAARYLKDLYNLFGDWLLVIAAYNGGPGYVYSAIRKSGSRNFWDLQYYLPAESRTHVKKFIGTHYIFEGQGGVTTLTKAEASEQMGASSLLIRKITPQELKNVKSVTISGKYNAAVIARYILMDMNDFNRFNPNFDKLMASADNSYELKLPAEKMDLFVANKYQILNDSVQLLLSGLTASNQRKPSK